MIETADEQCISLPMQKGSKQEYKNKQAISIQLRNKKETKAGCIN
jgi:hypothetical protein